MFNFVLADSGIPDKIHIYIILSCVIGVIVIFIIAGIVFFIYRRLSSKYFCMFIGIFIYLRFLLK